VNVIAISMIILIALVILYQHFQRRIETVNNNIKKVSKKNYQLQFNLSLSDELSDTEEEVSRLADELRKN
jgi:signal transduction histidine kinase